MVKKLSDEERKLLSSLVSKPEVKAEELSSKAISENDTKILSGEIMEGGKKVELSEETPEELALKAQNIAKENGTNPVDEVLKLINK